ncbi:M61 family metallopeptidase [Wielerella bovis]|uniref:M61 family metallopeptidase n=1 Tax=Wielerella bovis TaxID=2917790 RepID=UPI002019F50B|nr:M61 family peptidase [Wielerella bovis]MCG7656522.1 M61 family peptidase [Wielerella bovis]MCG7658747.1 M61 family peptidase [Wielerella bovis]
MLIYSIAPHPHRHVWHITFSYEHVSGCPNVLKLANWVAGSYMIRDFSRHIMSMEAACNGETVPIIQQDKNTWQLPDQSGTYDIQYTVYANDLSVRASLLNTQRGFIDGSCLFLYLPHRREEMCQVQFFRLPENWDIHTTLPRNPENHRRGFQAASYAELTDHPFELGANLEVLEFVANDIPHKIVLSGYYAPFDRERLLDDCRKICQYELAMFPQPAPFTEYLFLLHLGDNIYGGLEHRSSTALHADRRSLPPFGMHEANAAYTELLGLIAHEYFHAWNVKSIKPTQFQSYDLDKETYTEQLWAYEGITSYYDDLTLVRCGAISVENYLNLLANNITRVHRNAGRELQTLAQSSFAAWHKYYKQDENSPNAITSYYQQGALAAMCLDLTIRAKTQYSLDFVMQKLYERFVSTGKGTDEGEWQNLAQEFVGTDLDAFFQAALYSTEELPLSGCLKTVGVELCWQPENRSSGNGRLVREFVEMLPQPEIGCRFKQQADGAILTHVFTEGSAECASLQANDKIIAVDGFVCTDLLAQAQTEVGNRHLIHFFRQGLLHQTELLIFPAKPTTAHLKIVDRDLLEKWLFQ